jgi:hypothetical protein
MLMAGHGLIMIYHQAASTTDSCRSRSGCLVELYNNVGESRFVSRQRSVMRIGPACHFDKPSGRGTGVACLSGFHDMQSRVAEKKRVLSEPPVEIRRMRLFSGTAFASN